MHFDFKTNFVYWEKVKQHAFYKNFFLSQTFYDSSRKKFDKSKFLKNEITEFGENVYLTLQSGNVDFGYVGHNKIDYGDFKKEVIKPSFNNMVKELDLVKPTSVSLYDIWINYYEPGGFVGPHVHERVDISGMYIVNLQEKNNTIYTEHSPCSLTSRSFNTEDLEEGTILMWPSHLIHHTTPCKNSRVVLLFDLQVEISYGEIKNRVEYKNF